MIDILLWSTFVLLSSFGTLFFIQIAGKVFYQLAIDGIEIFTRWHSAKLDVETRHTRLEVWEEYAQMTLHERRQKLVGGGEK